MQTGLYEPTGVERLLLLVLMLDDEQASFSPRAEADDSGNVDPVDDTDPQPRRR
jgi:hypothetical protein